MNLNSGSEWRKQLAWGLVLIAVGVVILLQKLDVIELYNLRHHWPLLVVGLGIIQMVTFSRASEFTGGLWTTMIGLWLFAVMEGLYGLTFRNSWPLVIIVSGLTMIIEPLIKSRIAANKELSNEK